MEERGKRKEKSIGDLKLIEAVSQRESVRAIEKLLSSNVKKEKEVVRGCVGGGQGLRRWTGTEGKSFGPKRKACPFVQPIRRIRRVSASKVENNLGQDLFEGASRKENVGKGNVDLLSSVSGKSCNDNVLQGGKTLSA